MQTPILALAGLPTGPSNSAVRYIGLCAGSQTAGWATAIGFWSTPIARGGTISNIRARFPVTITTGSYELALMVNGAAVLTGTISTGTSLVVAGSTTVSAGDLLAFRLTPTSTPDAQVFVQISCLFEGTTAGKSVLFSSQASGTAAQYMAPGQFNGTARTDATTRCPMPAAGVIDRMYVNLQNAPGVGNSRTYTVYKNGSPTSLTVTIADAATSGNITGQNISWAAGDLINIRLEITGTPASAQANIGLDWDPDVDGNSLLFGTFATAQSASAARYSNLNGASTGSTTTESDAYNLAPVAFTARDLYAVTDVAPGAGKSRTLALRLGAASQALTAAISDAATTANDTTHTVSVAQDDLLDIINTPAGTPTANGYMATGVVAYIAPAGGGGGSSLLLMGVS